MLIKCLFILAVTATIGALMVAPVEAQDKDDPIIALVKSKVKDPAKPFTLAVIMEAKDGAKVEAAFAPAIKASRAEKGNLRYELNHDAENAKRYVLYERWKSVAALESHLATDHFKTLIKELPEYLEGAPQLKVFHIVAE